MLSIPHMIVLFVVVLVVFGPQKLPELARGLGKLMAEFRKASTDFRTAFEEEMREMERQARVAELKKQAAAEVAAASAEAGAAGEASPTGTQSVASAADADAKPIEELVISPAADTVARSAGNLDEAVAETAPVPKATDDSAETRARVAETSHPTDAIHDKQQPV